MKITAGKQTVKVKLSVCLINEAPHHEDTWGSGGTAPSFFMSALNGGEQSASNLSHFTLGERAPGTH
jgi:hypothetical protein